MSTKTKKPLILNALTVHFAALNFEQLDALKEEVDLIMKPLGANFANPVARDAVVKIAMASLASAGEKVTEQKLKQNIDTVNFQDLVTAIFSRNGFLAEEGDEQKGEAGAATSGS